MPQEGPDPNGFCVPECIWFKCGRKAMDVRGEVLWCNWLGEPCLGPRCSYSLCIRNKMLPGNRCGLVVKRTTQDTLRPEDFDDTVRVKGKALNLYKQQKDYG
jgi:hypothetical protein